MRAADGAHLPVLNVWKTNSCPQAHSHLLRATRCIGIVVVMYNVVRTIQLNSAGVPSPVIKQALGCCLVKLSFGVYSIVQRCEDQRHRRIRSLITDPDWIQVNRERRQKKSKDRDFAYEITLQKLRISSYPHYRAGDVIIGVSASVIHNLPLYRPPFDRIVVAHPTAHLTGPLLTRVTRTIPACDTVPVGKMVLTRPARAAMELIAEMGEPAAFAALDAVTRREVFGSEEAADRSARFGYPPDVGQRTRHVIETVLRPTAERLTRHRTRALRLVEHASALSESYAESRARANLITLGVNGFEPQVDIYEGSRHIARVDFMHRESRTILLVDGTTKYVQHGFNRMQKEADQYNKLISLGYTVIRVNFHEVIDLEVFTTKLFGQAPTLRSYTQR